MRAHHDHLFASDYRAAAQKRLPPFLFHYIDGGVPEQTLKRNVADYADVALRQRVLKDMSQLDTSIELFGEKLSIPPSSRPWACWACLHAGARCRPHAPPLPWHSFTLSTVSVCPIEEVAPGLGRPMWFQLYVLKDGAL
ncbi:alpha-hydroxy-acid oxidizing protein [Comamonas sp. JC664]|uniref:alpha-hydroxy-acid oxidizing protein n=1 Tax=Comamonas sp. JC664 TaxID=2801917 RepID=UPI00361D4AA3